MLTKYTGEIPLGIYRTDTEEEVRSENTEVPIERRKSVLDNFPFKRQTSKK